MLVGSVPERLVVGAQDGVYPALVAFSLRLYPLQHIGVQKQRQPTASRNGCWRSWHRCWRVAGGFYGLDYLVTKKRANVGLQCRVAAGPSQSGGLRERVGIELGEGLGEVIERAT